MGVTLAFFHSDGISPVEIVKLTRYEIDLAITGAASILQMSHSDTIRNRGFSHLEFRQLLQTKLVNFDTYSRTKFCATLGVKILGSLVLFL